MSIRRDLETLPEKKHPRPAFTKSGIWVLRRAAGIKTIVNSAVVTQEHLLIALSHEEQMGPHLAKFNLPDFFGRVFKVYPNTPQPIVAYEKMESSDELKRLLEASAEAKKGERIDPAHMVLTTLQHPEGRLRDYLMWASGNNNAHEELFNELQKPPQIPQPFKPIPLRTRPYVIA